MRFLVTGAAGFIGRQLCRFLTAKGHYVRAAVHRLSVVPATETLVCGDIGADTDWSKALRNMDAVIHVAAPAHQRRPDPGLLHRVNVDGSVNLMRQARSYEVPRMVYLSTIHVNGERTTIRPFSRDDVPRPRGVYAESKYQAEQALRAECAARGPGVVIVRAPLVYGPRVKGNLRLLMRAVRYGVPLPLRSVHNARSLVGTHNLCSLLETCAGHRGAVGRIYLVSDDEDVSTSALIRCMGDAAGRPARLWPFPVDALRAAGRVSGCGGWIRRLCDNLQVDISHTRRELGWRPSRSLRKGVEEMFGAG